MDPVIQDAARRDLAGEPYVFVTVTRIRPPTPAILGAHAIVDQNRQLTGYVGGECTRRILLDVAQNVLADGKPSLLLLSPDPDDEIIMAHDEASYLVKPMTCHSGGTIELFLEPHLPQPLLLIVGDSPVAKNLLQLASQLSFRVQNAAFTPEDDWDALEERIRHLSQDGGFAVLATMGQYDDWAIEVIKQAPFSYLGVVASPRRGELLRERFLDGRDPHDPCMISIPAGFDLHSRRPEEIAVSILAEIIAVRRKSQPLPVRTLVAETSAFVIHPVCHMTVNLAETPYQAQFEEKTWGFCAASCREAFLQEPERYVQNKEA